MCGRYVTKDQRALERELPFLDVKHWPKFEANYNIAPTQLAPVVIATSDGNVCELMRFGLVPYFAKGIPGKYSTINARVETVETSPAFRGVWKRGHRALVLASSFYEWQVQADGKSKQPYLIHLADQESFAMAGLWDSSTAQGGAVTHSFAIITLPASPLMAQIHNAGKREPAILSREDCQPWLSGAPEQARGALRQYRDDLLAVHAVSKRVNSPKNNDAQLVEPLPELSSEPRAN